MTINSNKLKPSDYLLTIALGLPLSLSGCATTANTPADSAIRAKIVQTGVIHCFEGEPSNDKPTTCELSAVVKAGNTLVFANDKPIPTSSPVLSIEFNDGKIVSGARPTPFMQQPFVDAVKYEALTATPNGEWLVASTAFDRYANDKPDLDKYNTLLAWPARDPNHVSVVSSSVRQGITSSKELRDKLLAAVNAGNNNNPYSKIKIEGLAAIPGDRLLFGVREFGHNEKDTSYTTKMIEAGYSATGDKFTLTGDFKTIYEFPNSATANISETIGLSSIEYDKSNDRLYILTSFEKGENPEDIGAYLWILPLSDLRQDGAAPKLVISDDGRPLKLTHKAEGLAVLDQHRILVINDDDRISTSVNLSSDSKPRPRQKNESIFEVLQIE